MADGLRRIADVVRLVDHAVDDDANSERRGRLTSSVQAVQELRDVLLEPRRGDCARGRAEATHAVPAGVDGDRRPRPGGVLFRRVPTPSRLGATNLPADGIDHVRCRQMGRRQPGG
jgi:hypothetical protein